MSNGLVGTLVGGGSAGSGRVGYGDCSPSDVVNLLEVVDVSGRVLDEVAGALSPSVEDGIY